MYADDRQCQSRQCNNLSLLKLGNWVFIDMQRQAACKLSKSSWMLDIILIQCSNLAFKYNLKITFRLRYPVNDWHMVAITCNISNQRVILGRAVYTVSTPAESHWTSSYRHTLDWFASLVNCYSVFGRNVYFVCRSIPYTWQLYSEQATCMAVSPRRKRIA